MKKIFVHMLVSMQAISTVLLQVCSKQVKYYRIHGDWLCLKTYSTILMILTKGLKLFGCGKVNDRK